MKRTVSFAETLGGLFGLDVRDEAIFILIDVEPANRLDRLANGRHLLHPQRFQGPRVEFDGFQAACISPGAIRFSTSCQALANISMSDLVDSQPKLIRIAAWASAGGAPIAARTWLGPTLPEEHAEPDDTATPAKSRAITRVSAEVPATATQSVWGNLDRAGAKYGYGPTT